MDKLKRFGVRLVKEIGAQIPGVFRAIFYIVVGVDVLPRLMERADATEKWADDYAPLGWLVIVLVLFTLEYMKAIGPSLKAIRARRKAKTDG